MLGRMGLRGRLSAPVRWTLCAVVTVSFLVRSRPRAILVQNPPIFASLLALAYCGESGARLVLDSHPVAFGRKDALRWRILLPLHRWVARRSRAVIVTEQSLLTEVEGWGARGIIVHEAPDIGLGRSASTASSVIPDNGRPAIFLVNVFASDEPVAAAVEAARELPELDLYVTGDQALAPRGLIDSAPDNVSFVGFLKFSTYMATVAAADAVMTLTTEPTSVMRSAYEAVYAGKPVIVSDWPIARQTFAHATYTLNTPKALARTLSQVVWSLDELAAASGDARDEQLKRWEQQLAGLRNVVFGTEDDGR
jgi:glycosyltransferase involved in cell wall biosynthesis